MLSEWCEVNNILHDAQMGSRRQRSAIDGIPCMVDRVQKAWAEGKLAVMLLIDVKGALDHVSRNYLLRTIDGINADGDLMQWTESFM